MTKYTDQFVGKFKQIFVLKCLNASVQVCLLENCNVFKCIYTVRLQIKYEWQIFFKEKSFIIIAVSLYIADWFAFACIHLFSYVLCRVYILRQTFDFHF